jgi:mono/diheme cytochrome c family protein
MNPLLASRRRIALAALGLILLLDLARSIYARVGYAQPLETWSGEPYIDLAWPPGSDLPADAPLGERVFAERCAVCHGPAGQGNGPAAPSMIPRPRDFTLGLFKYKSTPAGQPPSADDLTRTIAQGLQASGMPYFGDLLAPEEIAAVVEFIQGRSTVFDGPEPETLEVPPRPPADAASVERGRALYSAQGCAGCHGEDARGGQNLLDASGYPVISRDLTAPWTFRGGSEPEAIWLRLTTGLAPGPMPSYADAMTPAERWDVVNYVLSLARTPAWEAGGALGGPGQSADPLQRGAYLARMEMCGLCHTQVNPTGIYRDERYLAGGMRVDAYPQGVFVTRNLTGDAATGLGGWTEQEVANAIRNGDARGRTLNLWGMPWMFLHSLEQQDAEALGAYLKSQRPVTNRIPLPLKYGLVESIAAKIANSTGVPPLGNPPTLAYVDGNFGDPQAGLPRHWPQTALIWGQWLVLIAGAAAWVAATPRERLIPRGLRGCLGAGLGLLGLGFVALLGWVMYSTPVLGFIPPAQINQAVTAGIPSTDEMAFETSEAAALARRGEYLFTAVSCAFCHGNDGAGGSKISWQASGTLWARNITSDRETGIGAWSDAEIARAIRSGVTPDGRQLHWQGMIWDHLSNMDEEDVRALIAYLRVLPPVAREAPAAQPPSSADCEEYTFFVETNDVAGCR